MPLIDVTYNTSVPQSELRHLANVLPDIVAEAIDRPEEPWVGPPAEGDFEIRFRSRGRLDVGELDCVVEIRTKLFPSRVENKRERSTLILDRLSEQLSLDQLGVWLILLEGAWAQG